MPTKFSTPYRDLDSTPSCIAVFDTRDERDGFAAYCLDWGSLYRTDFKDVQGFGTSVGTDLMNDPSGHRARVRAFR